MQEEGLSGYGIAGWPRATVTTQQHGSAVLRVAQGVVWQLQRGGVGSALR